MDAAACRDSGLRRLGPFLVALLAPLLIFVGLIRPFVAEPLGVSSSSMAPTLRPGERVLTNKLAYWLGEPRRGDLVAFERSGALFIKRLVGLPGDRIAIRDGFLYVNGNRATEPYVDHGSTDATFFGPITVPRGAAFLLGDNRADSRDSRDFKSVPLEDLVGRVEARLWPPARVGTL